MDQLTLSIEALNKYDKLVWFHVKKLRALSPYTDQDDLYQEGVEVLIKYLKEKPEVYLNHPKAFSSGLYLRIRHHLLDIIKKQHQKLHCNHNFHVDDDNLIPRVNTFESTTDFKVLIEGFVAKLEVEDQKLFNLFYGYNTKLVAEWLEEQKSKSNFIQDWGTPFVAKQLKQSQATVHRRITKIKNKLHNHLALQK